MNDYIVSVIRTLAAAAAGFGVTQLARLGIEIDGGTLNGLATAIGIGVYYAVARLIEKRWPKAGVLLGVPKAPTYPAPAGKPVPPVNPEGNGE
ncbi:MAG: hypothetical protein AB7R77_12690 [Ilumatobacteraceae bacterium]